MRESSIGISTGPHGVVALVALEGTHERELLGVRVRVSFGGDA